MVCFFLVVMILYLFSYFSLCVQHRYSLIEEFTEPPPVPTTTTGSVASPTSQTSNQTPSPSSSTQNTVQSNTIPTSTVNASANKPASRKGGIIFPSVKNKPSLGNLTFATDILSYKDVKVSRFYFRFEFSSVCFMCVCVM